MPPAVRRVLYATDLSPSAKHAFGYALFLAGTAGAEIDILHVVERLSTDARIALQTYIQDPRQREHAIRERVQTGRQLLDEWLDGFWTGQDAETRKLRTSIAAIDVVESYPAEQILTTCRERDCDMIVLGAHERGLAHTFLGSVAKSVLRRARVPVMVVPLPED